MAFISYAQNFEDVVLWRALKGVNSGFYIDVGAADPDELSVTKAFYDQGWSGINLEPTEAYHARLVQARPRDLNLKVAAGAEPGLMLLHEIAGTGLSTASHAVARRHAEAGWKSHDLTVPVLTLSSICASYDVSDIHFLKIDVEGAEESVLRGMDFNRFRPWVVLVEATEPASPVRTDAAFERLLLAQRYRRAWFDGLNAFYVADEHAGLSEAIAVPPNVFDGYITARQHALERQAEGQVALLESQAALLETQAASLHTLTLQVEAQNAERDELREAQAAIRQAAASDAARLAVMAEEQTTARATIQRIRLHADQLKRRLEASDADAARFEQASLTLQAECDIISAENARLLEQRREHAALLDLLTQQGDRLMQHHETLRAEHTANMAMLGAVRVSTSWRLTLPMRVLGRVIKRRTIPARKPG